jgi:hypothetical protein
LLKETSEMPFLHLFTKPFGEQNSLLIMALASVAYFARSWHDRRHQESLAKVNNNLNSLLDRAQRSNEQEYLACSNIWNAFVEAFNAARYAIGQATINLALNDLPVDSRQNRLALDTELSAHECEQILVAENPDRKHHFYQRMRQLHEGMVKCKVLRDVTMANSVFIPDELTKLVEERTDLMTKAIALERTDALAGLRGDLPNHMALFETDEGSMLEELRKEFQQRLHLTQ